MEFANDDASMLRKCKDKNVEKAMKDIVNWFSSYKGGTGEMSSDLVDEDEGEEEEGRLQQLGGKRFIVFSICLPDDITKDISDYESIIAAVSEAVKLLNKEDYLFINMGNSA